MPIRFHCFLFSIVIYESDTIIVSCFPVAKDLIYSLFKITPSHNSTILVEIFLCWPSILKLFLCGCHLGIYLRRYFFNCKIFLYSTADVTSIPNIFRDTSALVLPPPPPPHPACFALYAGWFKRSKYRCTDEVVQKKYRRKLTKTSLFSEYYFRVLNLQAACFALCAGWFKKGKYTCKNQVVFVESRLYYFTRTEALAFKDTSQTN